MNLLEGHVAPEGAEIRGAVEIGGQPRSVLLEGPLYRLCDRLGKAADAGGGSVGAGGGSPGLTTGPGWPSQPESFLDPTFDAPECEPFK